MPRKIIYTGKPEGLFEYEAFQEFMIAIPVQIVSLSNNSESRDIVKQQIYHIETGGTLSWNETRYSDVQEHVTVIMYGNDAINDYIDGLIKNEASKRTK